MPRMTMFPGYDVPGPVGADYLNEEQDTIKRRRLELEKLLSTDQTKGMTGWAGGLSNLALGLAHGYHEGNLKEQEKDLSARRAEAAQKWLDRMPQDIAAKPEVNPSAPLAALEQLGGGPPMPQTYKPPVETEGGMVPQPMTYEHKDATPFLPAPLKDTAKWAMEGAGFSPLHSAIALDAYKTAMDRKKGTADKWETETITLPDGSTQKQWINKANPTQKPIPIDAPKKPEPKAFQQLKDETTAYVDNDPANVNKSPAEKAQIVRGLMIKAADIKVDPVTGEIVITNKPAVVGGLSSGGPVSAPAGATPGTAPSPPGTKVPPAVQQQRDAGRVAILQKERADIAAQPDSPQRTQSLAAVDTELEGMGVKRAGPPLGPGLKSEAEYRADPSNDQYLPAKPAPGVTRMGGSAVNAPKLNEAVGKLQDDYTKQQLSPLITAVNQSDRLVKGLAAKKDSGVKYDEKTGKFSGEVPGFGGPLGAMNMVPDALVPLISEHGDAMRAAMAPIDSIMLKATSGAAVTDQELKRFYKVMGESLGQNDAVFWEAYNNFKERLSSIENSVTSGYAPIVRDTYFNRGVARPEWGGGGTAAPKAAPSGKGWGKSQRTG